MSGNGFLGGQRGGTRGAGGPSDAQEVVPDSVEAGLPSRLDIATKLERLGEGSLSRGDRLARLSEARWTLILYPDAGEATATFGSGTRPSKDGSWGESDPDRSAFEAGRRARTKVRRYCAANRLDRLMSLTYSGAGCHDSGQVRADAADFVRQLRASLAGKPFPYVWVAELHGGGHGFHLHLGLGQYIGKDAIAEAWGKGFVDVRRLASDKPFATALTRARVAAGYLAKYIGKAFRTGDKEQHRYDVAQGFQPRWARFVGNTLEAVVQGATAQMGGEPSEFQHSSDWNDWHGPITKWMVWES